MSQKAHWQREQESLLVSSLPANSPPPAGMPVVYIPPVAYSSLSGATAELSGTQWAVIGVGLVGLVGLGVLLARSG